MNKYSKSIREYKRDWIKKKRHEVGYKKDDARIAVHRALKRGKYVEARLKKGRCEVCNSSKTQAHHDDYNKPLKVRWLCPPHHRELHKKLSTDIV